MYCAPRWLLQPRIVWLRPSAWTWVEITGTSCAIGIEWEKTSVVIPIQMDVARQAEMNIAKAIEEEQENWRVFRNSAQYYMNAGNMEEALVLIDRCLELTEAAGAVIGTVSSSDLGKG